MNRSPSPATAGEGSPTAVGEEQTLRDLRSHLAELEAKGLLVRVSRPIDKDTELHPLVRWQFQGGLAEEQRRAFLFTHVVDSAGRRYDMPVAVGALGASPRIYSVGMGRP
ncbi:MAG: UbiD family decarboxylase, partial [Chloroflexota bacterium]